MAVALAEMDVLPEPTIVDVAVGLPDPEARSAWVRLMDPEQLEEYKYRIEAGEMDGAFADVNKQVPEDNDAIVVPMRKLRRSTGWLIGRKWRESDVAGMDVVVNDEADIRAGRVTERTYAEPERLHPGMEEASRRHRLRRAAGVLAVGVVLVGTYLLDLPKTFKEYGGAKQNIQNSFEDAIGMNQPEPPIPEGLSGYNPFGPEPQEVRRRSQMQIASK